MPTGCCEQQRGAGGESRTVEPGQALAVRPLYAWFDRYVARFVGPDGELEPMLRLKQQHSLRVTEKARQIADRLDWSPWLRFQATAAALFHDLGRFPQFRDFRTFQDAASVNHGDNGAAEIEARTDELNAMRVDVPSVADAVRFHNRPALQKGLPTDTERLLRLVRDADKLDILEVVYDGATRPDSLYTELASWVDMTGPVSQNVVDSARCREPICYADLSSLADIVIMELHWVYDLNYGPSFALLRESGVFERLRSLIPAEPPEVTRLLDQARDQLENGKRSRNEP